jgi:hypothetical protein
MADVIFNDMMEKINAAIQRGIERKWLKVKVGRSGGIRLRRK